jgi:hypothetical protein
MRLGLVGSRRYHQYEKFKAFVLKLIDEHLQGVMPTCIVSGGAKGVDTLAEKFAKEYNLETCIYPVLPCKTHREFVQQAMERNTKIVNASDVLFAFPDGDSKGTWDTVRKARAKLGPFRVYVVRV